MILDEPERFRELDPLDMLGYINELPEQLQAAWELGQEYPLPDAEQVIQVVIAGWPRLRRWRRRWRPPRR